MAAIERVFTNVQGALHVNASTFSGAVDIIVVRHPDGSLHSTPFHVRFGKLQLLRPDASHLVSISVNGGAPLPFTMRLGPAGEAFFTLPGASSPSPPGSPVPAPLQPQQPYAPPSSRDLVPLTDALKLLIQNRDTKQQQPQQSQLQSPPQTPVRDTQSRRSSHGLLSPDLASPSTQSGLESPDWRWMWGELPQENPAHQDGPVGSSVKSAPGSPTLRPVAQHVLSNNGLGSPDNLALSAPLAEDWHPLFNAGALAADIDPADLASPLSSPPLPVLPPPRSRTEDEIIQESIDIEALSNSTNFSSPNLQPHPAPAVTEGESAPAMSYTGNVFSADVQISLCAQLINSKTVPESMNKIFDSHAISHDAFLNDPSIVMNPNLVARINGTYYAGSVLLAMLVSQVTFQEALPAFPLDPSSIVQKLPSKKQGRWNWRLWPFSWQQSPQPKQTSQTPPVQQIPARSGSMSPPLNQKRGRRSLRPTQEQLQLLGAHNGKNTVTFSVDVGQDKVRSVSCSLYLLDSDEKIVISDIDGTITKSDALGHIFNAIGKDWSHSGVAQLYTAIRKNGYTILYLTSRSIGMAQSTRNYISSVAQKGDAGEEAAKPSDESFEFRLPSGPVVMSPSRLLSALDKEVVKKCPQEFKIACLTDIFGLFPVGKKPFYAGFGNRDTDVQSYKFVNVEPSRIFVINPEGVVKSKNMADLSSYSSLRSLVDNLFPPLPKKHQ